MKKTIVECDRCHEVYGELDYVPPTVKYHQTDVNISMALMTSQNGFGSSWPNVDLCPNCRAAFEWWFGHPEPHPVEGLK